MKYKITEISPKSASKVFHLLYRLMDKKHFDLKWLKMKYHKYDSLEKYFICQYSLSYFYSKTATGFYSQWIEDKEKEYADASADEEFWDFSENLNQNKKELFYFIQSQLKSLETQFKIIKRNRISQRVYSDTFRQHHIDYKLPLFFEPNKFKAKAKKILNPVMSETEFKDFFHNSFAYFSNLYEVKLLYIECNDRKIIKEQMFYLIGAYEEERKHQLEILIKKHNNKENELPKNRRVYFQKLTHNPPERLDFAKALYNSFPVFRNSYSLKVSKNRDYSIEKYLYNLGSNFSIRT